MKIEMKVQDKIAQPADFLEVLLEPECVNIEDPLLFDCSSAETTFDNYGEYAFETDHLALKNNSDYYRLMKTLAILEGQRTVAIENIEKLSELMENSVSNPLEYVEKLRKGEIFSPPRIQVAKVPVIDWTKYDVNVPDEILTMKTSLVAESIYDEQVKNVNGKMVVRGRVFDESKPITFNQFWTPEEQRLLEELLLKHPPEPVELSRYRKIAAEMGNRTALQVQSRVQKYFIKLQKAGLPVPGRKFGLQRYTSNKRQKKFGTEATRLRHMFMPSTFWGSSGLAVTMTDDERSSSILAMKNFKDVDEEGSSIPGGQSQPNDDLSDVSEEEDIPVELRSTPEYAEILWLKFVKKIEKRQKELGSFSHERFKCDKCSTEPISGTRWHCTDCPEESSLDFCHKCVIDRPALGAHLQTHFMCPVLQPDD